MPERPSTTGKGALEEKAGALSRRHRHRSGLPSRPRHLLLPRVGRPGPADGIADNACCPSGNVACASIDLCAQAVIPSTLHATPPFTIYLGNASPGAMAREAGRAHGGGRRRACARRDCRAMRRRPMPPVRRPRGSLVGWPSRSVSAA